MPDKTSNYTKEQKEAMVKKELTRLKKIFSDLPKDKMDTCESLIQNAAFMHATLADLQLTINKDGAVSVYQNGENQWGTKKSPEVDIYNTMIKNHMNIIKQLSDMLPRDVSKEADDGFDDFVAMRG